MFVSSGEMFCTKQWILYRQSKKIYFLHLAKNSYHGL